MLASSFTVLLVQKDTGLFRTMNHINVTFSYARCFQGANLSMLYCKNWTYLPAMVKLLLGVNIRANIFRMEKQNITISDECSGFRAQFYSPRSEFIYDNWDLARARINGKFHLSFRGLTFEQDSRKIKQRVCILMIWTFTVKYAHIRDFAKQKS